MVAEVRNLARLRPQARWASSAGRSGIGNAKAVIGERGGPADIIRPARFGREDGQEVLTGGKRFAYCPAMPRTRRDHSATNGGRLLGDTWPRVHLEAMDQNTASPRRHEERSDSTRTPTSS